MGKMEGIRGSCVFKRDIRINWIKLERGKEVLKYCISFIILFCFCVPLLSMFYVLDILICDL